MKSCSKHRSSYTDTRELQEMRGLVELLVDTVATSESENEDLREQLSFMKDYVRLLKSCVAGKPE